ncbi:UDP-glucose 4-epimerase GalE [Rhizobium sp. AAP43]|uniref:UDP-glucose 4-epimerase GalE n=1 Tax=Rhizobium sp. AAP43 TaxID=1523420 RepID=UPI0006B8B482|nr:UDP-glucose 4-epimerase GalE [Rhizobium sp. AAP43]KPF42128.1 UDP-glucose 4-epimerase [Rhizobium sp. AAP43]
MAILVTGGAGYIGSHMVWALIDQGEDVVVVDRLSTGLRSAVAPEARFYLGDIGKPSVLKQIFAENEIEAVIHFAGSIIVPESIADPLAYYENNTGNTHKLLTAAVKAGIDKLIFSSTAAVYGLPETPQPIREDAPLRPETPYGQSKLMSEQMLRDTSRAHGLNYVALRYFNVAGADVKGRTGNSAAGATHLLKVACEAALGKRPSMSVYGTDYETPDGTGVRDFIHVNDLVDAHLRALDYLRRGGGPLVANCGYGRGYSVLDIIEAVRRSTNHNFVVDYAPRRPGDAPLVVADSTLARRVLGWEPQNDDLDVIVSTALAWERRLGDLPRDDIRDLRRRLLGSRF